MLIYTPGATFEEAAKALDKPTLKKSIEDLKGQFNALTGYRHELDGSITYSPLDAWSHAPQIVAWSGYVPQFFNYGLALCEEWLRRDFPATRADEKLAELFMVWLACPQVEQQFSFDLDVPKWLQDPMFVRGQQSALIRQSNSHYGTRWPDVPKNLAPLWPTNYADMTYKLGVSMTDWANVDRGRLVVPDWVDVSMHTAHGTAVPFKSL